MSKTIRTPNGRNAVNISADRKGSLASVAHWNKVTLDEWLMRIDFVADAEHALNTLPKFKKGYAFEAEYNGVSEWFSTEKAARAWCFSRDC